MSTEKSSPIMQILSGPRSGRPFKITLWLIASLAAAAFVHAEPGGERFGNSEVEALGELHETPLLVSRDGDGHEYRGGEIVVIADPEDLPKLAALKAPILEKRKLNGLGGVMVRIGVPLSIDPIKLREKISEVLKNSAVDVNGVYRASGLQYDLGAAVASSAGKSTGGLVGVVDTTIDTGVAELSRSVVDSKSFVNGAAPNRNHGTAVAYLAAIHGARLLGANVFARDRDGRDAASLEAMTRAVDWLALKGAVTINLSLEGPPNAVLRDVVRRAQSRGITKEPPPETADPPRRRPIRRPIRALSPSRRSTPTIMSIFSPIAGATSCSRRAAWAFPRPPQAVAGRRFPGHPTRRPWWRPSSRAGSVARIPTAPPRSWPNCAVRRAARRPACATPRLASEC
jgi:hypothetical protein